MLKELLVQPVTIFEVFKGFIILNVLGFPVTALLTFYMTVMGASNPSKPGLFYTLGIVIVFVYGTQLGVLLGLLSFGKIFDVALQLSSMGIATVSWLSFMLATVALVIAGNIFVDHLYQFNKGNYGISIFALFIIMSYLVVIYSAARIPVKWISF